VATGFTLASFIFVLPAIIVGTIILLTECGESSTYAFMAFRGPGEAAQSSEVVPAPPSAQEMAMRAQFAAELTADGYT
jgi:hypothetical protein